jgi:hypothetical protein
MFRWERRHLACCYVATKVEAERMPNAVGLSETKLNLIKTLFALRAHICRQDVCAPSVTLALPAKVAP